MADSNEKLTYIIIILFNCILYGLCCLVIIKRKNYTYISIRSPTLLLITNFTNFLIIIALLLFKITESNFISIIFYIFRFTMFFSVILRYERIITCIKTDLRKFYTKRHLLQEKFYVRMLIVFFVVFLVFLLIINTISDKCFEILNISNLEDNINNKETKAQIYTWIIWSFVELLIIITYIFRIGDKKVKHYLLLELYIFSITSLLFSNYSSYIYLYRNKDNSEFIVITLFFLYIYLIFNGLLPTIMSFCSKVNIPYYFTPKLTNNLYLFLANEECYQAFNEYLSKDKNGSFYLKLYTHIMKYKLDQALNVNRNQLFLEAQEIFNNYFNSEHYLLQLGQEIMLKVRERCQIIKLQSFNNQMFDDALQFVFDELNKRFISYKESNEFRELQEDINLYTFIQCKMCNTGLINKF